MNLERIRAVTDHYGQVWRLLVILLLLLLYLILAYFFKLPPFPIPYPPEEYFIQNQVIITGPKDKIQDATEKIETVNLERLARLDFQDLRLPSVEDSDEGNETVIQCPGLPKNAALLAIDLYQISGTKPDVEAAIEAIQQASGEGVSAEPNWVTGYGHDPGGSPFFEAESEDSIGNLANATVASQSDFKDQWAFQTIGLDFGMGGVTVVSVTDAPTGEGVRVGIFDTSPITDISTNSLTPKTYEWVSELSPLELQVLHPTPWATPAPSKQSKKAPDFIRQHGLSVAGLVHTVAPSSTIQLIRVLEDDNRGTLATLNSALFGFIRNTNEEPKEPTVINLSLGIRVPPEQAGFRLPTQVESLRLLMAAARCSDIVVVAASGNDSAGSSPPELANLPADWTPVINVGASNQVNMRSCFANQGSIAAPGGDGRDISTEAGCSLRTSKCNGPDCPYAIIGPVLTNPQTIDYIYWSGTSFAAPMVSGLAARVLEAGATAKVDLSPTDVQAIIECGATETGDRYLGAGVISMTKTLSDCLVLIPRE